MLLVAFVLQGQCPPIIRISKIIGKPIRKCEKKSSTLLKKSSIPTSHDLNDPVARTLLDANISRVVDSITIRARKREPLLDIDPNSVHHIADIDVIKL